jgi:transposase
LIQGCLLEAALGEQIGVSYGEWALIGPLLPSERGRGCRPAGDNRPYFEGMMWMARSGAQWRRRPDEYGKWNSVFRRYRRWVETGVFYALLETLAQMVERDTSADMIDSTVVRAHHCTVGLGSGLITRTGRLRRERRRTGRRSGTCRSVLRRASSL